MIPTNASLEEVIKYFIPREVSDKLEELLTPFMARVTELEQEAKEQYKEFELLDEQDSFKHNLLEEIQELCKQKGSKKDLVKAIELAFENSYVEM